MPQLPSDPQLTPPFTTQFTWDGSQTTQASLPKWSARISRTLPPLASGTSQPPGLTSALHVSPLPRLPRSAPTVPAPTNTLKILPTISLKNYLIPYSDAPSNTRRVSAATLTSPTFLATSPSAPRTAPSTFYSPFTKTTYTLNPLLIDPDPAFALLTLLHPLFFSKTRAPRPCPNPRQRNISGLTILLQLREHPVPARTSCTKTHQHRRAGHPILPTSLSKSLGNYTPVLPHQPLARAPASS
jgi:hypothetical protein